MKQLALYPVDERMAAEAKPLARRTDPVTSHMAAREMVTSGALTAQQHTVWLALREHPGTTSDELAARARLDRYMCARRMRELVRRGRAIQGERRKSTLTGRQAVTWRAVEEPKSTSGDRHGAAGDPRTGGSGVPSETPAARGGVSSSNDHDRTTLGARHGAAGDPRTGCRDLHETPSPVGGRFGGEG